jgi:hypothetical protein
MFLAGALFVGCADGALGQTYNNSPNTPDITYFGEGLTPYYGQVFVAPASGLLQWAFEDTDSKTDGVDLIIAQWNGNDPVGSPLAVITAQSVFNTGISSNPTFGFLYLHLWTGLEVPLVPGDDYIAMMTVIGAADPANITEVAGSTSSPLGGEFRFLNSGTGDAFSPPYSTESWDFTPTFPDLYYSATFGPVPLPPPPPPAPEPSTWALMLTGVGGIGLALRRTRRRQSK